MPENALPPELWFIIFDLLIDLTISTQEICNYFNFPEVLLRLQHPESYQPNEILARGMVNLRLVSRAFNELLDIHLKACPPYFLMESIDVTIPPSTKSLCIEPISDTYFHLERLLAEPLKAQRIAVLDIARIASRYGGDYDESYFDLVCDNARSLPAVRSLTMGLRHRGHDYRCSQLGPTYGPPISFRDQDTPSFWGRLNEAFPRLACLVLRGWTETVDNSRIVFKDLEILDMDMLVPGPKVQFPALRHAAVRSLSREEVEMFSAWRRLESLVIRDIDPMVVIGWGTLPHLRLLALPHVCVEQFSPLPSNHPLEHLYVYVDRRSMNIQSSPEMRKKWLKSTMERLPTIQGITFAYPKMRPSLAASLAFGGDELASWGLSRRAVSGHNHDATPRVFIDRVAPHPQSEPRTEEASVPIEGSTERKGLIAGWKRFRRITSRLHL